jgi:GMP synthase PP-ATPase subunit
MHAPGRVVQGEVRVFILGAVLGLPIEVFGKDYYFMEEQPFPGPGLAIRVRAADAIVQDEVIR